MSKVFIICTGLCLFLASAAVSADPVLDADLAMFSPTAVALQTPGSDLCQTASGVCQVAPGTVGTCCQCANEFGTREVEQFGVTTTEIDPKMEAVFSQDGSADGADVLSPVLTDGPMSLHPAAAAKHSKAPSAVPFNTLPPIY